MIEDNIQRISYNNFLKMPTVFDGNIENGCRFNISMMGDTMIIDKKFIDEIISIVNNSEIPKDLMCLLNFIQNIINNYFYSDNGYDKSRSHFYSENKYAEIDKDGAIIGTKISATKGKNIALCSEKSITAYIILEKLYKEKKISRKPSLVLSTLSTEKTSPRAHAFIIFDSIHGAYPTKYMLFDPENQSLIEDNNGNIGYSIGLYCLTDEQRENIINGIKCCPESIYNAFNMPYRLLSEQLIYGSIELVKVK